MPDANTYFAGRYVAAAELPKGRHVAAVITSVAEETMQLTGDVKLVVSLSNAVGKPWARGLVLNKTNGKALIAAYGSNTDDWIGHRVEVWAAQTTFAGKPTLGIRLMPIGNGTSAPMPAASPEPNEAGGGELDDQIPS